MDPLRITPATIEHFDDLELLLGPKKSPTAQACWCLSYRLGYKASAKLDAAARRAEVQQLCQAEPAPGILAYRTDDDGTSTVVGWAGVAPRAEVAELSTAAYPHSADDNPWSIFCLRTRAGMRKRGIGQQLLTGAINFAFDNGATVIEGYPLDTDDKVAPIFAYPGFRRMFEREGFVKVADTTSVLDGVPRILMRLTHQDR